MQVGIRARSDAGRMGRPVGGRREPEGPAEGRGERPYAAQPDREADVGHGAVGVAQQGSGALHPAGEQVLVRGLAEGPAELAAEVRRGESRRAGERRHVEWLAVAGVDEVLRAQQVPGRMGRRHRLRSIAAV
jgi:hypothetical protein